MEKDIAYLQGTWDLVHLEMEGHQIPTAGAKISLKGLCFTTTGMGATYDGTLEIDSSKKPKTFQLTFASGPEKGNTAYGIYELKGDTWKICLTTRGTDRPKKFVAAPGTGHAFEILERASDKPRRSQRHASPKKTVPDSEPVGPDNELAGEWSMVSGTLNGQPLDPAHACYGKRVTKGNQTTVFMGPQVIMKASFIIDPTSTPKSIDYVLMHGPDRGKIQLGIYELEGTSLTFCMGAPGKKRPGDFTSKPGDGRTLTAWTLTET